MQIITAKLLVFGGGSLNDNWIIESLKWTFELWNEKQAEIWELICLTPQEFKGGEIWTLVLKINDALQAIGYGLLVLFFAISICKSTINFRDFRRPEQGLRFFIRFVLAKMAVTYGIELMNAVFNICGGIVSSIASKMGDMTNAVSLPEELETAINEVGFLASIPLWLITIIGCLVIIVLSFVMILTVYSRFFKLYMYTSFAPIPLSSFAGETTSFMGKAFIKSYAGVCLEGAVIVLACMIFSAFVSDSNVSLANPDSTAVVQVLSYLAETIFNMLVLVGLVKGADRIVKEMLAL